MTQDEQNSIIANLMAQQKLIAWLLSDYVRRMSPEQRTAIKQAMDAPPQTGLPPDLDLNIDDADQLAGMAISHRDAVNRMFLLAESFADSPAQKR
jgi:hypothetical protein